MILIFGGAHQGKLSYALEKYGLTCSDIYKCGENSGMPVGKKIIYEIDKWIFSLVKAGINIEEEIGQFAKCNPDAVVICNDISCGIVPMDAELRKWREAVGRSLAVLSRNSNEVIRLFCGIPSRLK